MFYFQLSSEQLPPIPSLLPATATELLARGPMVAMASATLTPHLLLTGQMEEPMDTATVPQTVSMALQTVSTVLLMDSTVLAMVTATVPQTVSTALPMDSETVLLQATEHQVLMKKLLLSEKTFPVVEFPAKITQSSLKCPKLDSNAAIRQFLDTMQTPLAKPGVRSSTSANFVKVVLCSKIPSCAPTEPSSTSNISCVTGGSTSTAVLPKASTHSTSKLESPKNKDMELKVNL